MFSFIFIVLLQNYIYYFLLTETFSSSSMDYTYGYFGMDGAGRRRACGKKPISVTQFMAVLPTEMIVNTSTNTLFRAYQQVNKCPPAVLPPARRQFNIGH